MKFARLLAAFSALIVIHTLLSAQVPEVFGASGQWKITSLKICRNRGGSLAPAISAIGSYPVYSFFIPRPVWTVNGSVVEAQPVYEHGRLVEFLLNGAAQHLKTGEKNTIKFSLPDQTGVKVFLFQDNRLPPGECFEYF
jgi:hypothetical protein